MKKNILLVISKFPPEYSGPGVRIPRFYNWLKKTEPHYNVQVLCNGIEKTKNETYTYQNLQIRRITAEKIRKILGHIPCIPDKYTRNILYQLEFLKTLFYLWKNPAYKKTDLLHVAGHSGGTAAALLWAHIKDIPVLMELVNATAPHRQKFLFVFKTPILKKQKIIALTKNMGNRVLNDGLPNTQLWCRPNPIDEEQFSPPSCEEKRALRTNLSPFSDRNIVLLSVAKIMPRKNQFLVIKILPHLPEKFVALIAGPMIDNGEFYQRDFSYLQEMKSFITHHKLEKRVHLVTDFVEAKEYMKASDIYMMPAWNEGLGTPMIEAMACGLPVIANKEEPAFQEWIEDHKNGFLCDITKPEEWAKAVKSASDIDENRRKEIAQKIHKDAGQSSIYSHYVDIIKQLIQRA